MIKKYTRIIFIKIFVLNLILIYFFSCTKTNTKQDSLYLIKESGKWGYINSNGEKVIKCQFDWAGDFFDGIAAYRKDSLFGFINTFGDVIIKPQYYKVEHFSDGLCLVGIKTVKGIQNAFIKTNGTIAFYINFEDIGLFSYGRATVKINNEICFINKSGKVIINTHYPYGSGAQFHDGIAMVWSSDSSKYLDTNGRIIISFSEMGNNDFSEGLAQIKLKNKTFFIDKHGKTKIIPQIPSLTYFSFSDGLAQVVIAGGDHKSGFIDTTGKIVIPIKYSNIRDFKNGLAAYKENNKWGFINKKEQVVISPQFDKVLTYEGFVRELCCVQLKNQWGYINKKGIFIWKNKIENE